jgi:hypothetical protein
MIALASKFEPSETNSIGCVSEKENHYEQTTETSVG